jgi:hypothetical protein
MRAVTRRRPYFLSFSKSFQYSWVMSIHMGSLASELFSRFETSHSA